MLNSSHDRVLNEKNAEINELKEELDNIKENYEKLPGNAVDETSTNYTVVEADGKIFKLFSDGTEILENGIVCILEAFNTSNDLLWIQSWNELQVSELATYSPITISNDKVYIVISGELNVLNANTGKIIWKVGNLGSSYAAPLVDSDGQIYVIGQYNPYLTAINQEGSIMWQVNEEELYGASSIQIEDDYLLIKCYKGTLKYDKSGNRLE